MQFEIAIGDWSGDGHGQHVTYIAETQNTIEEVREAYFKLNTVLGFEFSKVCGEYEECTMNAGHAEALVELGVITQDEADLYTDPDGYGLHCERLAAILVSALNTQGVLVELMIKPSNRMPTLHFYGFDDKSRHIGFIGYGLLGY